MTGFFILFIFIFQKYHQNEWNKIKIALAFSLPVSLICIGIKFDCCEVFIWPRLTLFWFSIGSLAKFWINLFERFDIFSVRFSISLCASILTKTKESSEGRFACMRVLFVEISYGFYLSWNQEIVVKVKRHWNCILFKKKLSLFELV